MNPITFVRTRYNYDSYTDYWKLVELSGFPIIYVDEVDFQYEGTYILSPMNGEWRPYIDARFNEVGRRNRVRSCEIMLWNLERPGDDTISNYAAGNHELIDEGYVDAVLVSDMGLSLDARLKYMPLGSHRELGTPGTLEEKYFDLIHLSCYSNNRSWLFDNPGTPKSDLCGCSVAPNGWGEERHNNLKRSRFMLSVHQDSHLYIEPLRFALASAYGLPILSERYATNNLLYESVISFHKNDFCTTIKYALRNYPALYALGMRNHYMMTEVFTFRACVERFL